MAEDKIRIYYIGEASRPENSLDYIKMYLHAPEDISSRLVLDAENPEYIVVLPFIYCSPTLFKAS